MDMNVTRIALALAGIGCALPAGAQQSYPDKPVRLVVGFTAGGVSDIVCRLVAQKLGEAFGQTFVVENIAGAGGMIATERVAKSAPDGYTLLLASNGPFAVNPNVYAKLPYDPLKDFAMVGQVAATPFILVVNPAVPARTVREFIALARSKRTQLNYASAGVGSTAHLAGEYLRSVAKLEMVHVPYKGSTQALADLMSGQVDAMVEAVPSALPFVQAGRLRAVAVAASKRYAALPDLPTFAEADQPGYEVGSWFGIVAPAATPKEVIARLYGAIAKSLESADMRQKIAAQGAEPVAATPEQFRARIQDETARWAKVVKAAGIRPE